MISMARLTVLGFSVLDITSTLASLSFLVEIPLLITMIFLLFMSATFAILASGLSSIL
jgi:hypothetical protein